MALSTGDIIRVTDRCQGLGRVHLNVSFYRYVDVGLAGNTYAELASELAIQYENDIVVPVMGSGYVHDLTRIENMTNGLDIHEEVRNVAGGAISDPLPSFVSFNVKQIRETRLTRHGSKRIGFLTEGATTGNSVDIPQAKIDAIEAFYGTDFLIGDGTAVNDATLEPVIVGRTLNVGTGQYEIDLTRVNNVIGAQLTGVSSQVSRKT